MKDNLARVIKNKTAKLAVVGLGYVGLPLAVEFAKKGFCVVGIDSDHDRVRNIKNGIAYILDVPIADIKKVVSKKKLLPTTGFTGIDKCDVIIVCVPTPLKKKNKPNVSYIVSAVKEISKHLRKKQLVILESTTYPGTTEEVISPLLEKSSLKAGEDFYLSFSPERIDPGNKKYDFRDIPKIVGGINKKSTELACLLYRQVVPSTVAVSSARVAEFVKLLENTFRLINIGLINELAMMCHKMKVDIWEVIDAAKTKPFGFMPFYPGPGVGGHCIPKDPLYLYWKANLHGFKSRFIKLASDINSNMPRYIATRLEEILHKNKKKLGGSRILIIGVTYKKDVKDLRQSPSIDLIDILQSRKAHVFYHDPYIPFLKINGVDLKSINLTKENINRFTCVVIVTDHDVLDYNALLKNSKLIFDTRNVFRANKNKKLFRL